MKLVREILDYLPFSYLNYHKVIEEKLRHFHNIISDRANRFTFENAAEIIKIIPRYFKCRPLYCEFRLLKDDIDSFIELFEFTKKFKLFRNGYSNATQVYRLRLT